MSLLKYLFISLIVVSSGATNAMVNLKKCTLLPVIDNVDGSIAYKIFDFTENELKSSAWCSYRSNTSLLDLFSSYRNKLDEFLEKQSVIKSISTKLNVGSLIKVKVKAVPDGIELAMTIYTSEGMIFYKNATLVKSEKIEAINLSLASWLKDYEAQIPYDGLVSGVLGGQITFDVGRSRPYQKGQKFTVLKFLNYEQHPLVKDVVKLKLKKVASGTVTEYSNNQVVGTVEEFEEGASVENGFAVIVDKTPVDDSKFGEDDEYEFGKLGVFSLYFDVGEHIVKSGTPADIKADGILMGVSADAEAWITRNYFAILELSRVFGNLKPSTIGTISDTYSIAPTVIKLLGGYRLLPLRFFFGPRIDFYGGYSMYMYDVDVSPSEGLGAVTFQGLTIGTKASLPLMKRVRVFARAEVILFPQFDDQDNIFEKERSLSNIQFEAGGSYQWTNNVFVSGGFQITANKAKFSSGIREIEYKDNKFKFGLSYYF